jgi:aryl-alcohol dehydrogenase-like predicted oxidoreductase
VNTRNFGTTGLTVSEIGFGAWQLGERGWNGPDERTSIRLVHQALDAGVTFFDTAPCYGEGRSEVFLGRALAGRWAKVVLCTKFGRSADGTIDFDARRIRWSVEQSLRRLGTDCLDVLLLHSPPAECLDGETSGHFDVFEQLKCMGKLRAYGASVDWPAQIDTVLNTSSSCALEVWLSLFHQEPWEAVERAHAHGVGTIVKVPLESGWLAGKYHAGSTFSDVRKRWSREDIWRRAALVDRFRSLVPEGVSLGQAALRFLLAHKGVATVIPGAKTVAQLEDNLAAAETPLQAGTVEAMRALFTEVIDGRPLGW